MCVVAIAYGPASYMIWQETDSSMSNGASVRAEVTAFLLRGTCEFLENAAVNRA